MSANAWRCTVCGYIHRGPEPPNQCPVCGVGPEAFEPYVDKEAPPPTPAAAWRCLNCTYVHAGAAPPSVCPVCGAPDDQFKPATDAPRESQVPAESLRIAIIGAGIAGVSAAEAIRSASPGAKITILSREEALPYYRLNLTRYLAGDSKPSQLPLHPASWYSERDIDLRLGQSVATIDLEARQLNLRGGAAVDFDRLILTAGAHPFVPPIPGSHREGVYAVRTVDDADRLLSAALAGGRSLVLGGGILGLETAGALAKQGAEAHIVEGFPWLLPRQLNQRAGEVLATHVKAKGITMSAGVKVTEVVGDEAVRGLLFDGGEEVSGEHLVVTAGVRPNSYLARQAGLEVRQGVVVDNLLRTSDPQVFAAGDVAEHLGVLYGTWGPSQYQGSIAGMNAVGDRVEFGGIPRSNTLKVLGVDLFSIGVVQTGDASYQEVALDRDDGQYFRFVFRDGAMVGAILLGDTSKTAVVTRLVESGEDLSKILSKQPRGEDVLEELASR